MLRLLALLAAFALAGCGDLFKTHEEVEGEPSATAHVAELHAGWLAELAAASDQATGWPSVADCDAALWTGLAKAAGTPARLELAEHAPGEVHRRPTPCWTPEAGDVGSRSTVSRDMLTGYLWGFWAAGDAAPLQRLADYGAAHGWVMGLPADRPEVDLGDNLKGSLCRAVKALTGGADDRPCAGKAPLYGPVLKDYERHIQVLGILLQGDIDRVLRGGAPLTAGARSLSGGPVVRIDGPMLELLKLNASAEPADALFQAALGVYTGDYASAIGLLTDPGYACPSYVRGASTYCLVHKAFTGWIVLQHHRG